MSIVRAFRSGFRRAIAAPKMVLVLYVVNLLVAIPSALALRSVLLSGLGATLAISHLRGGLDFTVFLDFMNAHGREISAVLRQVSWVIIISMLINTFLSGGILSVLRDGDRKFSAASFFAGCGAYFSRFVRLFLIFVVLIFVSATILGSLLSLAAEALTENAASEVTQFWVGLGAVIVFLLPITIILMIADYAKIGVVFNDERSMLRSAWSSLRFVFRYCFRTVGLEVLMLLVPVVFFFLYLSLDLSVGMSSALTIIAMMIIQQLFIFCRAWARVFFFAGEMSLYQSLRPAEPVVARNGDSAAGVEPANG